MAGFGNRRGCKAKVERGSRGLEKLMVGKLTSSRGRRSENGDYSHLVVDFCLEKGGVRKDKKCVFLKHS